MDQSAHLAIRAAIAALMLAGTPLASGRVHENRDFVLAQGIDSQVHVNFVRTLPSEDELFTDQPRDWESEFELKFLTRASGGSQAHDVADALWVEAYARLMADQGLGGLVWDLQAGEAEVDTDEADTSVCRITWRFTCRHRTANNSIAS